MFVQRSQTTRRRGKVVVLFALMLSFLMVMTAFAVDIGWVALTKAQLQAAADAAALAAAADMISGTTSARATAKDFASKNVAGGTDSTSAVTLQDSDVVFGLWNSSTRSFTANAPGPNAVQVTARKTIPMFFARVTGMTERTLQASATAVCNPRDIAFIIDLSGSMNNDTEIWATSSINSAFSGYPTIGTDLMSAVFDDFGFGSYPGTLKSVGEGTIPSNQLGNAAYNYLSTVYLLGNNSVPSQYRTSLLDSASTKKTKTYSWIIDYQLASIMPNAKPAPSSANLGYWSDYLDYIIAGQGNGNVAPPPNQNSYQLSGAGNPYADAWPGLGTSSYSGFFNKLGYQTYVQFMMDYGWNKKANGNSTYTPLSRLSADCPWRADNDPGSPGYGLSFPPREQPTHAVRLAVMAAINKIAVTNAGQPEASKDHVCVITFDTAAGVNVRYPLSVNSCDYDAARASVRDMQAVADDALSTASENGLLKAKTHLDPTLNPTGARPTANKLLIFLSDGIPNLKQSANSTIDTFKTNNPLGEWFTSGSYTYERNATLMQIMQLQSLGWKTHVVGVGLGADRTLMDRMARMAGTAIPDPANPSGLKISPYADGNPADYQTRLTSIFNTIVGAPNIRLVK